MGNRRRFPWHVPGAKVLAAIIYCIPPAVIGVGFLLLIHPNGLAAWRAWGIVFLGLALCLGLVVRPTGRGYDETFVVARPRVGEELSNDLTVNSLRSSELAAFLSKLAEFTDTDWQTAKTNIGDSLLTHWRYERGYRPASERLSRIILTAGQVEDLRRAKNLVFDSISRTNDRNTYERSLHGHDLVGRIMSTEDLVLADRALDCCTAIVVRGRLAASDFRQICKPFLHRAYPARSSG